MWSCSVNTSCNSLPLAPRVFSVKSGQIPSSSAMLALHRSLCTYLMEPQIPSRDVPPACSHSAASQRIKPGLKTATVTTQPAGRSGRQPVMSANEAGRRGTYGIGMNDVRISFSFVPFSPRLSPAFRSLRFPPARHIMPRLPRAGGRRGGGEEGI